MIITIQPLKRGYAIIVIDTYEYPTFSQYGITKEASEFADEIFSRTGKKPMIKWLSIKHTPMATKKTYPAKKKAVVAKKKAVKKKK